MALLWCQTPLPPFNLTGDHVELSRVRPGVPAEAHDAAVQLTGCQGRGHEQTQPDQKQRATALQTRG